MRRARALSALAASAIHAADSPIGLTAAEEAELVALRAQEQALLHRSEALRRLSIAEEAPPDAAAADGRARSPAPIGLSADEQRQLDQLRARVRTLSDPARAPATAPAAAPPVQRDSLSSVSDGLGGGWARADEAELQRAERLSALAVRSGAAGRAPASDQMPIGLRPEEARELHELRASASESEVGPARLLQEAVGAIVASPPPPSPPPSPPPPVEERASAAAHYYATYKPCNVLCSWEDDAPKALRKGRARRLGLGDLALPPHAGLHNVGRLDRDSEGLLLLTTDGKFTDAVANAGHVPKRYWALVAGVPDDGALAAMAAPIEIRGRRTLPCTVRRLEWAEASGSLPPHAPTSTLDAARSSWVEVVLTQGLNRQVRRLTASAGFPTVRLVRVGIGALELPSLKLQPGEWCEIEPESVLGVADSRSLATS